MKHFVINANNQMLYKLKYQTTMTMQIKEIKEHV